ncbi:poly-gamma-glutamate synthase PgsB, partial [uncultured Clostridium sp.]|uniref:poly-gamma-glutamate synthase PgsB n=1 Tax=uncultured Clostridium sp. TaxID=59620 RepID=UPI0028F09584
KKLRKKFRHIIHVNGTRGKSTTCRLIDAAIRGEGYKVFCKTTGTSPRIIDVLGDEKPIIRKGKANIKEQIKILKEAARQGADIVVIECMAVKPDLQYIAQNKILNGDICIVTNARRDHLEEMGPTLEDVAESLGNVMPKDGYFITAEERFISYYKERGEKENANVILAEKLEEDYGIDFSENISIVLEVCKILDIDREAAIDKMKEYKRDPGVLKTFKIKGKNNNSIYFVNGFAINDPDSTINIYNYINDRGLFKDKDVILMINNRRDRVYRMEQHVSLIKEIAPDRVWISGYYKGLMKSKLVKKGVNEKIIDIIGYSFEMNLDCIEKDTVIFGIGNIAGSGEEILEYIERVGDVYV